MAVMNLEGDILGRRSATHVTTVYTKHGPKKTIRQSRLPTLAKFISTFLAGRKEGKKTECWNWLRSTSQSGYGQIMCSGKNVKAHRIAYLIHYGDIPDCKWVLHRCDNPRCVNPHHLFLGNASVNVKDMVSKNRHVKGQDHKLAKLKTSDVLAILRSSDKNAAIARRYGVSHTLIGRIRKGDKWKHCHAEALSVKSPLDL